MSITRMETKTKIKTFTGVIFVQNVLADVVVSVSELKKNPSAVLNHNRVMGYMVPAEAYEAMIERLDDLELAQVANARIEAGEKPVRVSLADLIGEAEADIANGR